jgi:histidine triad (HIT) family protein
VDQLMRTAQRLSPALEKTFDALRVVLVIEWFEVPHAHIHLVPMTQWVTLKDSKRETISSEELQKIHEKIENTMSE